MQAGKVFFTSSELSFSDYVRWRRDEKKKQYLANQFQSLSRSYLAEGSPRFLGVFAHDGHSQKINAMGRTERWQFDTIFDALRQWGLIRGVALDIGANIGIHSIFFASLYETVYAFEPHPNTFRILSYNLETYAPGSKAYQLALFSSTGTMPFDDSPSKSNAQFSLVGEFDSPTVVETIRLDEFGPVQNTRIGLVKIDVEGAEYHVLQGARETLAHHRPVVILEDWESKDGHMSDALKLLESLGYTTILEPAFHPNRRREHRGWFSLTKLLNAVNVWRHGHSFVLKSCDFMSPRGYQLLLALHPDHLDRPPPSGPS